MIWFVFKMIPFQDGTIVVEKQVKRNECWIGVKIDVLNCENERIRVCQIDHRDIDHRERDHRER
jgi:hypothetical protein